MIFGLEVTSEYLVLMGLATYLLLTLQIAMGMRWIRLKGRTHSKVHKWGGWSLLVAATLHAGPALTRYFEWRILG